MITETEKDRNEFTNVWVIGESQGGEIQAVTYELLGAAKDLAAKRNSQVWCVLMGNGVSEQSQIPFHYGADKVLVVDDPSLARFIDEVETNVLCRLIENYKPEIVLCGATSKGRALIPRVAVKVNAGLTADCTGLDIDPETGNLLQTRPAFGGNIMATIKTTRHRPQMSTVRPRVMTAPEPDTSLSGEFITEPVVESDAFTLKRVVDVVMNTESVVNLSDAQFIISGGRGLKGPEGFEPLEKLARMVDGAVGASRAAVDAGWIPYSHQVGQTGQTVQSKVYIACGISGQIQHLVGMQSCDFIIAINKDPEAPLMKLADIAVVGDVFEILPEIMKQIPKR
ncbi:MAG: electron transfer flavoprotein subunit alpha/FixB family protein [Spirochaetia bacterium]